MRGKFLTVSNSSNLRLESLEQRVLLAGDLTAHWRANDLVGAVADGSTAGQWNDSIAAATATATGSPRLIHRAWGGRAAMRFDGSDGADAYEIAFNKNPLNGANDFSVAVMFATSSQELVGDDSRPWFEATGLVDANTLGFGRDWGLAITQTGQVGAGLGFGFGQQPTTLYSNSTGLNDGQLHSAVFTRSGTTMSMFIDGDPVGSRDDGNDQRLDDLAVSFGMLQPNRNPFSGDIAEIRFYDGALAAAEATELHEELSGFYNNSAPVANADSYQLQEDPLLFIVPAEEGVLHNDMDAESDPLTAVLVTGTRNGELGLNGNGSFVYNPDRDFFGSDSFTYAAFDLQASEPVTVTLIVQPVYDAAVATDDHYRALPSEPLIIPSIVGVLANDKSPDQVPLTAIVSQEVSNGALTLNADGSFVYDAQGFSGTASFQYQIDDGTGLSSAAQVDIVVNTTPEAQADEYAVNEDMQIAVNAVDGILSNDLDADGDVLLAFLVAEPSNGSLGLQADGSFIYVPHDDYFGNDQFTYSVTDGVDSSSTTNVSLIVQAINDPPQAVADSYFTLTGEPLIIPAGLGLLANDSDVDDTTLTVRLTSPPSNGSLELADDGSFNYSPDPGYLGEDVFRYVTTDGRLDSEATEVVVSVSDRPVIINEFMAMNATVLETRTRRSAEESFFGDEESPDWIELRNLVSAPINIGGMHLTDDPDNPTKWEIPEGTIIPADGYLIVFASSRDISDLSLDETGRLHANFSLDSNGDYLALATATGEVLSEIDQQAFGRQTTNVSFGFRDGQLYYFDEPTPGEANRGGLLDIVADTDFSIDRGYFEEAFEVVLSSATPGATLVYTTNGDDPTLEQGTRVDPPDAETPPSVTLTIDKTTSLRAAAFKDGYVPTNVDTQTYFFVADTLEQSNLWSTVTENDQWGPLLTSSLLSVPTVSLVLPGRISQREEAVSVELIFPDGTEGFQIDAGVEHYGGHSLNSPKKNMRLSFKAIYGDSKLNYDLFGGDAVDEFNQLLLRTGSHDTWFWTHPAGGQGNYTRNRWAYDRQLEMGHLAPHGRFVQVYINGEYWGMHQFMERPNAAFMASYLGGEEKDYDALNAGAAIDGDATAWRALQREEVIDDYEQVKQYLDVTNYADYMLLQFYAGNDWDWNHTQNWAAARKREDGAGYVFFSWDSDVMLRTTANANVINRGGPGDLWNTRGGMKQHDEFLMLMADRAHRLFFNGGMLTDERLRQDIDALADEIRLPVVAETARWGNRGFNGLRYTPDAWEASIRWMRDRYAPEGEEGRTATVISQLRRAGVYPAIDAPEYSVNGQPQHGGDIATGDAITISAGEGIVYYTTDGADPRLEGGALNPDALIFTGDPLVLVENMVIRARLRTDDEWSALSEATFRVDTIPADASNLRISEVHYHPADPSVDEIAAGYGDADDFEFIELVNISDHSIDLNSVRLLRVEIDGSVNGVGFDFSAAELQSLAPGQRLIVVENIGAFQTRYGRNHPVAGEWNGGLNNRQEQLLLTAGDETIHQFTYSEAWHPSTDGNGPSLVVVDPMAALENWNSANGWRPSPLVGGSPGAADETIGIPGDSNRDGVFNSSDLVQVFQVGEYEDEVPGNSSWEDGDWNGDGDFTTNDLVVAFQAGTYVAGAHPAARRSTNRSAPAATDLLRDNDDFRRQLVPVPRSAVQATPGARGPQRLPLVARDLIFEEWKTSNAASTSEVSEELLTSLQ